MEDLIKEIIEYKLSDQYKEQICITINHLLRLRFDLKNLEISNDGKMISIQFEDDGIHTKEMVESFLNEFMNENTDFKNIDILPKLH
jgi:hypothetical protein